METGIGRKNGGERYLNKEKKNMEQEDVVLPREISGSPEIEKVTTEQNSLSHSKQSWEERGSMWLGGKQGQKPRQCSTLQR